MRLDEADGCGGGRFKSCFQGDSRQEVGVGWT